MFSEHASAKFLFVVANTYICSSPPKWGNEHKRYRKSLHKFHRYTTSWISTSWMKLWWTLGRRQRLKIHSEALHVKHLRLSETCESCFPHQYQVTALPVLLRWSHFKASVSIVESARILKLYEVNGPNTKPQLMVKQWRSREMLTVVMDIFFCVKSYPEE